MGRDDSVEGVLSPNDLNARTPKKISAASRIAIIKIMNMVLLFFFFVVVEAVMGFGIVGVILLSSAAKLGVVFGVGIVLGVGDGLGVGVCVDTGVV